MNNFVRVLFLWILLGGHSAWALDYKFNGFMSLVAGDLVSGDVAEPNFNSFKCPCFIADYNNGALYEDGSLSLKKESRVGGQINLSLTDSFSLVGQAVARASTEEIKVEWAYFSWAFASDWTLQVGRKRIPLYYYSDFQDVGLSYTWVRPPQTLYGWEASNYNGVSLRYMTTLGGWDFNASVYAGQEEVPDSGYSRIYNEISQDVRWKKIMGGDLTFSREWFTGRLIYMTSDNSVTDKPDNNDFLSPATQQTVLGLALNADFDRWFLLSEFNVNTRKNSSEGLDVSAPAVMLGVGRRMGAYTLFASGSRYWEKSKNLDAYLPERYIDSSLTLRYDINSASALKFQVDKLSDRSQFDFVGNATLVSVAYDLVF